MENEILLNLKNLSFEIIVMAIIVFGLTMIIKYPIKKKTEQLSEEKRKAVNTVIILIPIILSFVANAIYQFGIRKIYNLGQYFEVAISINFLATFIYAVVSRIIDIIKGIKSGKIVINQELSKNVVQYVKDSISTLNSSLNTDKKSLSSITKEMENLINIKLELSSGNVQDLKTVEDINNKIDNLKKQENKVNDSILNTQKKLDEFNQMLYKENN